MSRVGQHLHRYPHSGTDMAPWGRRCATWRFVAIYSTRILLLPRAEPPVRLIHPGNQGPRKLEFAVKFHARLGVRGPTVWPKTPLDPDEREQCYTRLHTPSGARTLLAQNRRI